MENLVEVHRGGVYCDSQTIAEKFGYRHQHVVRVIDKLLSELETLKRDQLRPLDFVVIDKEYKGRPYRVYEMDRRAFSLLSMRFTGIKALEWQVKFNDAFYLMEKQLLIEQTNKNNIEWVKQREQGKLARKAETDTLKLFVDYAISQGSQKAEMYYKHFTLATYKCLNLMQSEKPSLRNTLDVMELNQLMMAEHIAEKSIQKHMAAKEHYKAIYTLVKADLEKFADAMLISCDNKSAKVPAGIRKGR